MTPPDETRADQQSDLQGICSLNRRWWCLVAANSAKLQYVPDPVPHSAFVITAYEVTGKALAAHRRRKKKKHR